MRRNGFIARVGARLPGGATFTGSQCCASSSSVSNRVRSYDGSVVRVAGLPAGGAACAGATCCGAAASKRTLRASAGQERFSQRSFTL